MLKATQMLVTLCWWQFLGIGDGISKLMSSFEYWCPTLMWKGYWWRKRPKPSPTSQTCPQPISSPTSVTNIDVDDGKAGDRGRNNLCTPFKHDIRCASLCGVKFVVTKERREKRAQRESCLKGVRSLQASLPDRTGPYLNGQSYHPAAWLMPYVGKNNLWVDDWE